MLTYLLSIIGLIFLLKGADILVDGASSLARRLRVSDLVIGLTVVSFGTSAPELSVNILAAINGNGDIAIGNILGSNIANILLILGIAACIYPLAVRNNTVWKEVPLSALAALVIFVMGNDYILAGATTNILTRSDGLILLFFFLIFLAYIFAIARDGKKLEVETVKRSWTASLSLVGLGLAGLVIGGKWVVDGAVTLAQAFNVSQSLIGLTVVAVGTSLPELATSAVAAYRRNVDIAVGNVVGSNIFNIFFILGISSAFGDLALPRGSNLDLFVVFGASLLLFAFLFIGKKHVFERWQGIVCIVLYLLYLVLIIIRG